MTGGKRRSSRRLAEGLSFLDQATAAAAALEMAYSSGVVAELERGPRSLAELARQCALEPGALERLLGALEALGLAEADPSGLFRLRREDLRALEQWRTHLLGSRQEAEHAGILYAPAAEAAARRVAAPHLRVLEVTADPGLGRGAAGAH